MLLEVLDLLKAREQDRVAVYRYGDRLVLERVASELRLQDLPAKRFALRVQEVLAARIKRQQRVEARDVAHDLDLSVTSLHRFLRAEAVTFYLVLDSLRREIARDLLSERTDKPSEKETMVRLGYRSRSSCFKAMRRWGLSR